MVETAAGRRAGDDLHATHRLLGFAQGEIYLVLTAKPPSTFAHSATSSL